MRRFGRDALNPLAVEAAAGEVAAATAPVGPRGYDPFTILVLAVMAPLCISSTAVIFYGVPRPSLASVPLTAYMMATLRGRLNTAYALFGLFYLLAFLPGTIVELANDELKLTAAAQAVAGVVTFATVASYFERWLLNCPPRRQRIQLGALLAFYFVFSVVELGFYEQLSNIRLRLYPSALSDSAGQTMLNREQRLYGGRPTGLFSEASHFARFVGLIAASYMVTTRNSLMSLVAIGVFLMLTRSVSFLFAGPALVAALFYLRQNARMLTPVQRVAARAGLVVLTLAVAFGAVAWSQRERLESAVTGGGSGATASADGSLNARLLFPLHFALHGDHQRWLGMGLTPEDTVQEAVLAIEADTYHWQMGDAYMEGIDATIIVLIGMGVAGLCLFFGLTLFFQRWQGAWMLGSFFVANLISSGFNNVACFVPSALLLALVLHARRVGIAERPDAAAGLGVAGRRIGMGDMTPRGYVGGR